MVKIKRIKKDKLQISKHIKINKVKKGSLMWKLLGFDDLYNPNSQLRKTLDKIAKGDKMNE